MKTMKKTYTAPVTEVIRPIPDSDTCQTAPVYFSKQGPGTAGAKEFSFSEEGEDDKTFDESVWED